MNRLTPGALLAVLAFFAANSASADVKISTSTFTYTGGTQTYTVPATTNYVVIKAWGAGGGGGPGSGGGGGGFVQATFSAQPGDTFTIYVGEGGAALYGAGTWGGGWPNGGAAQYTAGSGGGRSEIDTPYGIVVGGAGGGGGTWSGWAAYGGGAGGSTGQVGMDQNGGGVAGGGGASQVGPGYAGYGDQGNGFAGSFEQGGLSGPSSGYSGAGGGDGYYGGGGGGSNDYSNGLTGGGGGGGSSIATGSAYNILYQNGNGYMPGGTGDADYNSTAYGVPGNQYVVQVSPAYGGAGQSGQPITTGGNGYIVISAYNANTPAVTSSLAEQYVQVGQSTSYAVTATHSPTSYGAIPRGQVEKVAVTGVAIMGRWHGS